MWKLIKIEDVFNKSFLSLLKIKFQKKENLFSDMFLVIKKPVVIVNIYDTKNKKILFVKQQRPSAVFDTEFNGFVIEPVAGVIDDGFRNYNSALLTAIKEVKEETGIDVNQNDFEASEKFYLSAGYSNEFAYWFDIDIDLSNYKEGDYGLESEGEFIETMLVNYDELESLKDKMNSIQSNYAISKFKARVLK